MSRDKKMDIAITVMFFAIYLLLLVASSFLKVFGGKIIEHLYHSALEVFVFSRLTYKILYWICGKLDEWGI